jgi:hypothetical protein
MAVNQQPKRIMPLFRSIAVMSIVAAVVAGCATVRQKD